MQLSIHQITKISCNKNSLDDCTLDFIYKKMDREPYNALLHLLLVLRLKQDNDMRYDDALNTAALFFPNRMWLDYQLNHLTNSLPADHTIIETENEVVSMPDTPSATVNEPTITDETIKNEASAASGAPVLPSSPENTGMELNFEPYHTVDYFASQRIKYLEDEKPKDALAVKIKSFTAWLKEMKNTNAEKASQEKPASNDSAVHRMAASSLQDSHIATEAMAEIWLKQGNIAEAIKIYEKLSLQFPEKSTYFAALIIDLRQKN